MKRTEPSELEFIINCLEQDLKVVTTLARQCVLDSELKSQGGKKAASNMTAKERSIRAKKASNARK